MSADNPHTLDAYSSSSSNNVHYPAEPVRHWVMPQHMRQRSVPFGHHRRAFSGEVVLALRRAPKLFQFLDAQVVDVALRRGAAAAGSSGEGIAQHRSNLPVELAYPLSQLYDVIQENETPRTIARKFGLPLADLLAANTHKAEIQSHSKLRKGTEIVLSPFPDALDAAANISPANILGDRHVFAPTCPLAPAHSHWDLEYLVQYLHGGQVCGAREWLRPELIFQTHTARVVMQVGQQGGVVHAGAPAPTKAQLLTSMVEGISMDRWRFPKVKDSVIDYLNSVRCPPPPLVCITTFGISKSMPSDLSIYSR